MTTEDSKQDISIAFERLAITSDQNPPEDLTSYKPHILTAIADIRNKRKRPDINNIYDHMMINLASNIDKDFVNTLIDELIKKGEIFNKPPPLPPQGLDSLYISSKSNPTNPTENSPINPDTTINNGDAPMMEPMINLEKQPNSLDVNTLLISDKSNCNFSSSKPRKIFRCNDFVKNEIFDTFYEAYLEFKHYVNDIIETITPSSDLIKNLSNENVSKQKKIEMLQEEIKLLRNENISLKEDIKTQIKAIENLSDYHKRKREDNNNEDKINQNNKTHENQHEWQNIISKNINTNNANASDSNMYTRNRKSNPVHFEICNKFSLLNNEGPSPATVRLTSEVPKKDPIKPQQNQSFSNNKKAFSQANDTARNKRPDVCITEKYISKFKPLTVPGHSNYASITKNGRKILVVSDNHIKRIRRNDFNKELKNGKAFFRSFSGSTSKQLNHYIIPSLVGDKPDAVIIHVATNNVLNKLNHEDIARNIIYIALICRKYGVNDIAISSVLIKKNPNLNALVRRVNDLLYDLCAKNGFGFISNEMITTDYLWKDGIHLLDLATNILSSNFIEFVNKLLINSSYNCF